LHASARNLLALYATTGLTRRAEARKREGALL
jgi:hypothetical protein